MYTFVLICLSGCPADSAAHVEVPNITRAACNALADSARSKTGPFARSVIMCAEQAAPVIHDGKVEK